MIPNREEAASWPDMVQDRCIVCGRWVNHRPDGTPCVHHIPPIGTGKRKAWEGALVALCGTGTTGCHGRFHHADLELGFIDGAWRWRGTRADGYSTDVWIPCQTESEWDETDWLERVM